MTKNIIKIIGGLFLTFIALPKFLYSLALFLKVAIQGTSDANLFGQITGEFIVYLLCMIGGVWLIISGFRQCKKIKSNKTINNEQNAKNNNV